MPVFLTRLTLPFAILMIAFATFVRAPALISEFSAVLLWSPYVILPLIAGVALFLMHYALVYTAVLLLAAYWVIQTYLQTTMALELTFLRYLMLNLLLPLLFVVVGTFGEKSPMTWQGKTILGLCFLPIFVALLMPMLNETNLVGSLPDLFYRRLYEQSWLSMASLSSYVPSFAFLAAMYWLQPTLLRAFWVYGLSIIFLLFLFFSEPLISAFCFSILAALLLIILVQELFELAYVDELTNIPGRKALEKNMASLGRHYSLAMLDVDHFKKFNDTYGHDVGDQVLRMVAQQINNVSGGGKAFRYGGEEFTILFPGKNVDQVKIHLEMVREAIATYTLNLRDNERPQDDKQGKQQRGSKQSNGVSVTISIGVAEKTAELSDAKEVIKMADKALYKAKSAGRNRVVSF
ncbi:GGDEF domain-containing protein [Reinekea sp.]|uniref:GGDEF domain-containing protein n=1 Tax=Reinekea sp. TaxID=1970455 RepID=UPI0039897CB8